MPVRTILTLAVQGEADGVLARQRARQIAELLGCDPVRQTRLATAVSEVVRDAATARVEYQIDSGEHPVLYRVQVTYRAAAAERLPEPGVVRRLVDHYRAEVAAGGAPRVVLGVLLPRDRLTTAELNRVVDTLAQRPAESLIEEVHRQNQELVRVLEDLTRRQEELARLNQELEDTNRGVLALYSQVTQELEDTNRGVLALYSELDEQAAQLRRANRLKSQFFSYVSHEFRTPLHSSVALCDLMLAERAAALPAEQRDRVGMIRRSTSGLLELVGDLLDLAKLEAGKLEVQVDHFTVAELFSALRGMFRPLVAGESVALVFEEPGGLPPLRTDQRKLGHILRNLVANALKFTPRGEVRVAAALEADGSRLRFTVADTGVGIAPQEQERIFEDFTQARDAARRPRSGTGLGLPLSRHFAHLLGGTLTVRSAPGEGSTFTVSVPLAAPEAGAAG